MVVKAVWSRKRAGWKNEGGVVEDGQVGQGEGGIDNDNSVVKNGPGETRGGVWGGRVR